jgi:crotonobetainyl-CoA:carnitine CoA-transferase CaiB-like acyl-CoA transferase
VTVRPLDGVRVLDLTRLLPGAYATLLLADLGADVVKIEDPRGGDGMRSLPTSGRRPYFELLNRRKRSVTLDLRSPEASAVLDALCTHADVVVDSFRPSTARRLGVDAATIQARHPRLVCASISGFGQAGPYAERAAHDINYQALAGLLRPPQLPGPLVGDIGAATQTAIRILAALVQRARTGVGSVVDVSIHDAAMAWSMFPETGELENACYNVYETADGEWLALGALEPKFWQGFCERIERPDLVPLQHAHGAERERVVRDVREVLRGRTRGEWLERFAGADVCLTTIYTPDEVASDPHVVARGEPRPAAAPALGADTDAVLEEAGITEPERARLRSARVI